VLNYLFQMAKGDYDADDRVRRRTVRMRRTLAAMYLEGMRDGEFTSRLKLKDANELLYSFVEAAIFRMVVLRRSSVQELKDAVKLAVQRFAAEKP